MMQRLRRSNFEDRIDSMVLMSEEQSIATKFFSFFYSGSHHINLDEQL